MSEQSFHPSWHLFHKLFSRSYKRVFEANMTEKGPAQLISRRTLLKRSSIGTLVAAPASVWSLAWASQRVANSASAGAAGGINVHPIALQLDTQIRAVCPDIDGVWIGNLQDRTTWGIWFRPSATSAQKKAAYTALANFVPD